MGRQGGRKGEPGVVREGQPETMSTPRVAEGEGDGDASALGPCSCSSRPKQKSGVRGQWGRRGGGRSRVTPTQLPLSQCPPKPFPKPTASPLPFSTASSSSSG